MKIQDLDFNKGNGLIPVIVQDASTKDILMFGYADREAVEKTVETHYTHLWSRSRKTLWKKGETSGNVQEVKDILVDCDEDTLVYVVKPHGPACHTGNRSCFYRKLDI
ncbi:MAG: phosphoribosyl-AMP cyclohydrolase [Spirochaetes bacterium]|nr:MAG: phosphoribosyl-AMP cyclohydrolase [Spirochaetota bacterium]